MVGAFMHSKALQEAAEAETNWLPTKRYGYRLSCETNDLGDITMTTTTEVQGQVTGVMREVIRTKEDLTRQALIKLGWTPPSDAS